MQKVIYTKVTKTNQSQYGGLSPKGSQSFIATKDGMVLSLVGDNKAYMPIGGLNTLKDIVENTKEGVTYVWATPNVPINEGKVESESDFKGYATTMLKEMHGDKFDSTRAKKIIDGLIEKYGSKKDWSSAIGSIKGTMNSPAVNESIDGELGIDVFMIHKFIKGMSIKLISDTNKGYRVDQTELYDTQDRKLRSPKIKKASYSSSELKELFNFVDAKQMVQLIDGDEVFISESQIDSFISNEIDKMSPDGKISHLSMINESIEDGSLSKFSSILEIDYLEKEINESVNAADLFKVRIGDTLKLSQFNKFRIRKIDIKNKRFYGDLMDFSGKVKSTNASVAFSMFSNPHYNKDIYIMENKINESNSNENKQTTIDELGRLTGLRKSAIANFVNTNNVDAAALMQAIGQKKFDGRDLVTAISGKPNNKYAISTKTRFSFEQQVNESKNSNKVVFIEASDSFDAGSSRVIKFVREHIESGIDPTNIKLKLTSTLSKSSMESAARSFKVAKNAALSSLGMDSVNEAKNGAQNGIQVMFFEDSYQFKVSWEEFDKPFATKEAAIKYAVDFLSDSKNLRNKSKAWAQIWQDGKTIVQSISGNNPSGKVQVNESLSISTGLKKKVESVLKSNLIEFKLDGEGNDDGVTLVALDSTKDSDIKKVISVIEKEGLLSHLTDFPSTIEGSNGGDISVIYYMFGGSVNESLKQDLEYLSKKAGNVQISKVEDFLNNNDVDISKLVTAVSTGKIGMRTLTMALAGTKNNKSSVELLSVVNEAKSSGDDLSIFKVGDKLKYVGAKNPAKVIKVGKDAMGVELKIEWLDGRKGTISQGDSVVMVNESVKVGVKSYRENPQIGSSKYSINTYDGKDTHKDGSPFVGIYIAKNKGELKKKISELEAEGYISESKSDDGDGKVETEAEFRAYAKEILKEMHGDKYDEKLGGKFIDDMVNKYGSDDGGSDEWGDAVGVVQNSINEAQNPNRSKTGVETAAMVIATKMKSLENVTIDQDADSIGFSIEKYRTAKWDDKKIIKRFETILKKMYDDYDTFIELIVKGDEILIQLKVDESVNEAKTFYYNIGRGVYQSTDGTVIKNQKKENSNGNPNALELLSSVKEASDYVADKNNNTVNESKTSNRTFTADGENITVSIDGDMVYYGLTNLDGVAVISRPMLKELEKGLGAVTILTNAGVDLHTSEKDKFGKLTIKKVKYDDIAEFVNESNEDQTAGFEFINESGDVVNADLFFDNYINESIGVNFKGTKTPNRFEIVVIEGQFTIDTNKSGEVVSVTDINNITKKATESPIYDKYSDEILEYTYSDLMVNESFDKIYDKFNKADYFDVSGQISTQLNNWESAMARGDKNAAKYTKKIIEKSVIESNKIRQKSQTYDKLVTAIQAKDISFLMSRVRFDQKFSLELFTDITGIKLGGTNKIIQKELTDFVNEAKVYDQPKDLIAWFVNDVKDNGDESYSLPGFEFLVDTKDLPKVLKKNFKLKELIDLVYNHSVDGQIFLRDNFLAYESNNGHIYLNESKGNEICECGTCEDCETINEAKTPLDKLNAQVTMIQDRIKVAEKKDGNEANIKKLKDLLSGIESDIEKLDSNVNEAKSISTEKLIKLAKESGEIVLDAQDALMELGISYADGKIPVDRVNDILTNYDLDNIK